MSSSDRDSGIGPQPAEVAAALGGLREATKVALEPNDLGRLAQMHSECQTLAELEGEVGRLAAALADLLEGVILKEAADEARGLALIPRAVEMMEQTLGGVSVDMRELIADVKAGAARSASPDADNVCEGTSRGGQEASSFESAEQRGGQVLQPAREEVEEAETGTSAEHEAGGEAKPAFCAAETYVSEPLVVDLSEREHLEGFIEEAREHMHAIEVALLEVEKDPADTGKINELFRPFHTIKGIAGFLNLRDINRLTHEVETILDLGRRGELAVTPVTIDLIFSAIDVLNRQISELASYLANPTGDAVPQPNIAGIMAKLRAVAVSEAASDVAGRPQMPSERQEPAAAPPEDLREADDLVAERGPVQVAEASIRVDTAKLDFLVDAVGELVIAQTMVQTNEAIGGSEKLSRDVGQVSKIVREVQETAMAMRMIPIAQTFQKMRRLVRDVARKADKRVELLITGEDTELDKNVIQAISDPLVHMVRNAVDHGIEPPQERRRRGKPEVGTVHLHAYHQGDSIVIEIRDDGRGLDREKLIAKARERGLISSGEQLTDQQVFGLIFQPGFSTAAEVTDISGRGVGMDVVKRNVEQLRGKIDVSSEPGQGSVFTVRLPLTLAIIDGMLIRVGRERLIIPTIMIEQSLRPEPRQITSVQRRGTVVEVRGELIPLVQLGALFGYSRPVDPTEGLVVVAFAEGQKIGIVVSELIGQQQVVIKTLGERFKRAKGVSGAAILGDGHVGLILEPTSLLELHNSSHVNWAYRRSADEARGPGDLHEESNGLDERVVVDEKCSAPTASEPAAATA